MLPRFRNETTSIAICHDQIGGIRRKNNTVEGLTIMQYEPSAGGPHSMKTLEALNHWLERHDLKGKHASVVLSNSFVRYALVPWSGISLSTQEEDILLRTKFEESYGDMEGWRILANEVEYGKHRIACAMHNELAENISYIWKKRGIYGGAIVPYFVACWNRWHRNFQKQNGMIAIAEIQNVVIGCFGKNGWSSIRLISSQHSPPVLSDIVFRENLLQGHGVSVPVWIHYAGPLQNGINSFNAGEQLLALDSPFQEPCLMMAEVGCFR